MIAMIIDWGSYLNLRFVDPMADLLHLHFEPAFSITVTECLSLKTIAERKNQY